MSINSDGCGLVPFGKYKGRPVEVLAADPQYAEWMAAQPWVRQKHPQFYQVIINNFQAPSETPEHNALQAKFLDDGYCLKFLAAVSRMAGRVPFENVWKRSIEKAIISEANRRQGSRVRIYLVEGDEDYITLYNWTHNTCMFRIPLSGGRLCMIQNKEFETEKGVDVRFIAPYLSPEVFLIEVKPHIGDDYPSVLRQMKRSGARYLLVGTFQSQAITTEQFIKFFATDGIRVVFDEQVEVESVPAIRDTNLDEMKAWLREIAAGVDGIEVVD